MIPQETTTICTDLTPLLFSKLGQSVCVCVCVCVCACECLDKADPMQLILCSNKFSNHS